MLSPRPASFAVVIIGAALTALYAVQVSPLLSGVASLLIGVGGCVLQGVALKVNRPPRPAPWRLSLGASIVFLAGITIRPSVITHSGPISLSGDACTLTGYLLLAIALLLFLREDGGLQRHALTDGVIVCLGTGLVVTEYLGLPAARIGNRPAGISLLAGLYPLCDVVLLLLLLNIGFSTATRLASFRFYAGSMSGLLIGDLGYAWIGAKGQLTGSPLLDVPFLLGFTLIGASALHPSMTQMSSAFSLPVLAWSPARLALILPALATPAVVILIGGLTPVDRSVLAVATAGLMGALLFRAISAVHSHAQIQEGLLHRAGHDQLTGLPNRALLTEQVTELLRGRRSEGAWLLFLDLDGFKLVNDHWGHEIGDVLLIEVSRRLSGLAGSAAMVARISGDEFVLAGSGSLEQADDLARRIRADLARPVELPGIELMVTGSIGIAEVSDQLTAESLLRDADLAMYRAKADGRNRSMVFDPQMRQSVRDRVEIELALRHAVARHQLWVAFQPIVDCRTGQVVGAEALLRWTHPERGSIPPTEFIPVAEETGLIDEIGAMVMEQSLHQLALWRDEGILPADFYLSVNASTRQLRDHGLRDLISAALRRHDLGPERLVVEITESIMMDESQSVSDVLGGLRDVGVGLSVDDFGTGYSSLSYLSRFPVTSVKIDRAFVSGLGIDPGDEAIVKAVVAMASALNLSVIAEGVETEQQRLSLVQLDVERAQGWLWAKAEDPFAFAERHLRDSDADATADALAGI